jgi:uncharacterized protein involved in tolerance to divalent cations
MINIVIYIKKEHSPKELVELLLQKKLIASASIDVNNVLYKYENENFSEEIYTVVTAQTKSLLFTEIANEVKEKLGEETPVNAIPIIGSNKSFDELVKTRTKPV